MKLCNIYYSYAMVSRINPYSEDHLVYMGNWVFEGYQYYNSRIISGEKDIFKMGVKFKG